MAKTVIDLEGALSPLNSEEKQRLDKILSELSSVSEQVEKENKMLQVRAMENAKKIILR